MEKVRKPEIARIRDMVGIILPYVLVHDDPENQDSPLVPDLDILVGGDVAIELGHALIRVGGRLNEVHNQAIRAADMHHSGATAEQAELARIEFIRESMIRRLGLTTNEEG